MVSSHAAMKTSHDLNKSLTARLPENLVHLSFWKVPVSVFFLVTFVFFLLLPPAEAEYLEETGSLRGFLAGSCPTAAYDNWISHVSEGIADPGYNDYGPQGMDPQTDGFGDYNLIPDTQQGYALLAYWRTIFQAMLQEDIETVGNLLADSAQSFHYEAVLFHDTEFGRDYLIAREQLDSSYVDNGGTPNNPDDDVIGSFRNGWGIFIVSLQSSHPYLCIQTPHPCDDFLGVQAVVELFLRLDAGTMCITGAGREVLWTGQNPYYNSRSLSDPSRYQFTPFQEFTSLLNETFDPIYPPGVMIFQIHSYDGTRDGINPVVMTAGYNETYIHKPLRDRSGEYHDFIGLTPYIPVEAGHFGDHPELTVDQYFWLNYNQADPYLYDHDGDMVQIPYATEYRCDPNNVQENYLHSDYPSGSIFENFFHVEQHELPDVLEQNGITWADLIGDQRPPTFETFAPLLEFYEPFYQAMEDWFTILDSGLDETPPDPMAGLTLEQPQPGVLRLTWSASADANFATYQVLASTGEVNDTSTVIWDQSDDRFLRVPTFTGPTDVTGLQDGFTWHLAMRAVDFDGNSSELSDEVMVTIPDETGIGLAANTFDTFPLAAWPAWGNVQIDDVQDVDSIILEWSSNQGHEGQTDCFPAGVSHIWGASFEIPQEELSVGDIIEWRIHATDISETGNPTQLPENGWFSFELTDEAPLSVSYDFELDDGAFTEFGDWEWGSPEYGPESAHSGENLWGTDLDGQYMPNSNSRLTMPSVNLGGYAPLLLSWWQWIDYETVGGQAHDGGFVAFRQDDQVYPLEPIGGYPYTINSPSNPHDGEPVFSGSRRNWQPVTVDLRPLFGMNNVSIEFYSCSDLGGQHEGWYIDDVQIVSSVNFYPPVAFDLISPPEGTELPDLTGEFSWHTSLDPDPYSPAPEYDIVFTVNDDTARVSAQSDTSILVQFDELDLHANETAEVTWWVEAISQGDRTRSSSTRTVVVPPFNMRLDIPLQGSYFELISTYILPQDLGAEIVFGDLESLRIAYQDDGGIYLPPFVNMIGDINVLKGYTLFCWSDEILSIEGTLVDPQSVYTLAPNRWLWLGYPFPYPVPVEIALSEIEDAIVIIQADDGRFWVPGMLNTLGDMLPGEGYYLFLTRDVQFTYHDLPGERIASGAVRQQKRPQIDGAPTPTGLPYIVLLHNNEKLDRLGVSTIELLDGDLVVGRAILEGNDPLIPVVAWRESRDYDLAGFHAGDPISVRLLNGTGEQIAKINDAGSSRFGEGPYAEIHLNHLLADIPVTFQIDPAYPNPFNPSVTVPYAIPTSGEVTFQVFNLLGQEVFSSSRRMAAGFHRFQFNAGDGVDLVSGMYFLKISFKDQQHIQKLLLMK